MDKRKFMRRKPTGDVANKAVEAIEPNHSAPKPTNAKRLFQPTQKHASEDTTPVEPLESRKDRDARLARETEAKMKAEAERAAAEASQRRQAKAAERKAQDEKRRALEEARVEARKKARASLVENAKSKAEAVRREAEAKAAAEAKQKAEEDARRKAQDDARKRAEEEIRKQAEKEARKQARQVAREKAKKEAARRKAEEDARKKAADDARRKAEEAARKKAADDARRKAEEAARKKAEDDARRKAEEATRKKAEEAARKKAEDDARRKAEEAARKKAEDDARRKAEAAARKKAEDDVRRKAEAAEQAANLEETVTPEEALEQARLEARRKAEQAILDRARKKRPSMEPAVIPEAASIAPEPEAELELEPELEPTPEPPVAEDVAASERAPAPLAPASRSRRGRPDHASPDTPADSWGRLMRFRPDEGLLDRNRIVSASRYDPAHTAFDILRTRLLQALSDRGWKRVVITSPTKGCGKSFTAANLAVSLARQENCRTLLLDMDLRQPSLHKLFGVTHPASMGDFLRGKTSAEDYFLRLGENTFDAGQNIAFGFNGQTETYAAEMLQDPRAQDALAQMEDTLEPDVVLMDAPPALYHDDVMAMRSMFDGVLLVVGGGLTTSKEIKEVERRLGEDTPLLGTILNRAEGENIRQYSY